MDDLDRMTNPSHPDVFVEHAIARAEVAQSAINRATADLYAAIEDVVSTAVAVPAIFVDPDRPLTSAKRSEFAERAAVADLAVRLNLSETAVRTRYADALAMRSRLPKLWAAF